MNMAKKIIEFFSSYDLGDNEKSLFLSVEQYLVESYFVRPMMVHSVHEKENGFVLSKSRAVLGKTDRLTLYNVEVINLLLNATGESHLCLVSEMKFEAAYYYFINLGIKNSQRYFALFSTVTKIDHFELDALARFSQQQLKLLKKFEDIKKDHELIYIDDVTGIYNQRKMYKDLHLFADKFFKLNESFSVLFVDLDYFKKVNDQFGHLIGSRLLEQMAIDIKALLRDGDHFYRYGGDEFVIILDNVRSFQGKIIGERILEKIKNKKYEFQFHGKKEEWPLSVSIGVAEFPTDAQNVEEVLVIADKMMYEAKESGRGKVFNTQDVFKSLEKKVNHKE